MSFCSERSNEIEADNQKPRKVANGQLVSVVVVRDRISEITDSNCTKCKHVLNGSIARIETEMIGKFSETFFSMT